MLVTARLEYVADSEWGSRRHLGVSLLDEQSCRSVWECSPKVRKIIDSTLMQAALFQKCKNFFDSGLERSLSLFIFGFADVAAGLPSFGWQPNSSKFERASELPRHSYL